MYKRIVLKLSGEALAGERGLGIDAGKVTEFTGGLDKIHALGVEMGWWWAAAISSAAWREAKAMGGVSSNNMGMFRQ